VQLNFKSIAHISEIEGNKRSPGDDVLPALAAALGVQLEVLKNHDVRAPIREAKELFAERPEMVAAFRRVVEKARGMSADDLLKRIGDSS
jgi:transcriptional regulator with XRE-family HTH domain